MPQFRCSTNEKNQAVELPLFRVGGTAAQNPHMRAFWGATVSFFLIFLGWFAFTPLELQVARSLGICEDQRYPADLFPTRSAFLTYKNLATMQSYCQYGVDDRKSPRDCRPVPATIAAAPLCNSTSTGACSTAEQMLKYRPKVLESCICTSGTECAGHLADGATASVASTILTRAGMGRALERFGPVNVQCALLVFGAVWVAAGGLVTEVQHYIVVRFFIGMVGGGFVTDQFWTSLMFAPQVVGSANAMSAGWGNLGGGATQIVMPYVLVEPLKASGVDSDVAWRVAMLLPAALMLAAACILKLTCWDSPRGPRLVPTDLGKTKTVSLSETLHLLKDMRVWVMIFQYASCFGTEIAMYNRLPRHLSTNFQMKSSSIAVMTSVFGLTNLFSRPLGGILSDLLYTRSGLPGRLWLNFWVLFLEAFFLFVFASVTQDMPVELACVAFLIFSISCEMGCGTAYGIVPFMSKEQMATVSAFVGAGGNLGALIANVAFYKPLGDSLNAFKVHAGFVMFWAFLSPVYYWPEHGGMFSNPDKTAAHDAETASTPSDVPVEVVTDAVDDEVPCEVERAPPFATVIFSGSRMSTWSTSASVALGG